MAKKATAKKPTTAKEFQALVNKTYGSGVITGGGTLAKAFNNYHRFSSGILGLDEALGGGWPFSRVAVAAGEYSTGKTELAIQACISVENYDHLSKVHRLLMPENSKFTPGRALYVDAENAFDLEWARLKGFNDDHHMIARTANSEEAIDVVSRAIEENVFDLIVLDSIAQMTPQAEIESSAEDWQMGLAARLNNKAFRKWNSALAVRGRKTKLGPLVLCLNQMRINIGQMFGDPRTLPGGKGQTFCSSVIVYTKPMKYDSKEESSMATVALAGIVHKNKTYMPRQNFAYQMAVKETADLSLGDVNNTVNLVKRGKEVGLIKANHTFGGTTFGTETALKVALEAKETLRFKLWRSILAQTTGCK